MTPLRRSNPYDELEEQLRIRRNLRLEKDRILREEAQEKRRSLQAQKDEKFSTADIDTAAQKDRLTEKEQVKTDALIAQHAKEFEQLREQQNKEIARREEDASQAYQALFSRNSIERDELAKAFQEKESAIEAELQEEMRNLQNAGQAEDEEIKKSLWQVALSRIQPTEPAEPTAANSPEGEDGDHRGQSALKIEYTGPCKAEGSASKSPLASQVVAEKPNSRSVSTLQPQLPRSHDKSNTSSAKTIVLKGSSDILGKRNSMDETAHRSPGLRTSSSVNNPLVEASLHKRSKITDHRITLDPRRYFEVSHLRHVKHSSRNSEKNVVTDLWSTTTEKLYLHMQREMYRPVLSKAGKPTAESAANWFIERMDIIKVQFHPLRCLGCLWTIHGLVWAKFKGDEDLSNFMIVLTERWSSILTSRFSDNYLGFPTSFGDD